MRSTEKGEENIIYYSIHGDLSIGTRFNYRAVMKRVSRSINKGATTTKNGIYDRDGIRTRNTDNTDSTTLCCGYSANGCWINHIHEYYACSFLPNDGSIFRREVTTNVTLQNAMTIRKNI